MKRLILLILVFLAFSHAKGREYLVRLDARSSDGLSVIELIDDQALVIADDNELERLAFTRTPYSILDPDPRGKLYLLVFPIDGSVSDRRVRRMFAVADDQGADPQVERFAGRTRALEHQAAWKT
jgi:hypothetical protein